MNIFTCSVLNWIWTGIWTLCRRLYISFLRFMSRLKKNIFKTQDFIVTHM